MKRKIIGFLMAAILTATVFPVGSAAENVSAPDTAETSFAAVSPGSYADYIKENQSAGIPKSTIEIDGSSFSSAEGFAPAVTEYNGHSGVVRWDAEAGSLTYPVTLSEAGLYRIALTYNPLPGHGKAVNLGIAIDGKVPFSEAASLHFPRIYKDETGEELIDFEGNQYAPDQVETDVFTTQYALDNAGVQKNAYSFYLSAEEHSITLSSLAEPFVLEKITLEPAGETDDYKTVLARAESTGASDYDGDPVLIEGENAALKTSASLIPISDNGSPSLSPVSSSKSRLNYIGGSNWCYPNDTLTWELEAPESGFYRLGFRFRQSYLVNGTSYRKMTVDGKPVFREADCLAFKYSPNWSFYEYNDENNDPYRIYLEKGNHTLSLSVTMGELGEISSQLQDVISSIGDLYVSITMITGENVDNNRSYELFRQILGFNDTLQKNINRLTEINNRISEIMGEKTTAYSSSINNMIQVMQAMLDNKYTSHRYRTTYYNNYCSLSTTLNNMNSMALDIDQIVLSTPNREYGEQMKGFFANVAFSVKRFFYSFAGSYNTGAENTESSEKTEGLTIWLNWGREQTQVVLSQVQNKFVPEHNIPVTIKLTNASTIQAILSGKGPDLVLSLMRSDPVNYAMRGALYDLTQFDDYDEVMKSFQTGADIPYRYNGGVYALPETQTFYMMFVRDDIFRKIGLSVPKTWDEFIETSTILQRNNLQAYLPYTQIVEMNQLNSGIGGLNIVPTLLAQNGLSLYNSDQTASTLTDPEVGDVFETWVDYYTKLKYPVTSDFYNRFRVGISPMGIFDYKLCTTLDAAAPEIEGCWSMYEIPGVLQADGTVNNAVAGTGTGDCILAGSKHKQQAWEFLKWWTGAETQTAYCNGIESVLGTVARVSVANKTAFGNLSWNKDDLTLLKKQWAKIVEIPEIPGSYYTARGVDQVFWNSVNNLKSTKDLLAKWGAVVNNEIERKRDQYAK